MLWTLASSSAIALRSCGSPPTSVYLPNPPGCCSSAERTASLMWVGVSKSGSPAPKLITSTPAALSLAALAVTASVIDGLIGSRRDARLGGNMGLPVFFTEGGDHSGRYQSGHVAAQASNLFHERRAHVVISLVGHEEHGVDAGRQSPVHVGELELVLEVGERAQAAHDHGRAAAPAELDEQALEHRELETARVLGEG